MEEKYDLERMLAEIREDEELDLQQKSELSQDEINNMMLERLRKRKAETQ